MPCLQTGDGSRGDERRRHREYADDQLTNVRTGHFRPSRWFPKAENVRICDFSDDPVTVQLSDGSKLEGLGLIVRTSELYKVAVTGKIACEPWIVKLFSQRRMVLWGLKDDGGVVIVKSNMEDLEEALRRKKLKESYPTNGKECQNKTPAWMTASIWSELGEYAMTVLTRGKENEKWCKKYASLDGRGAPWNKDKHSSAKRKVAAPSAAAPRNVRMKKLSEDAAKARAANAAVARAAKAAKKDKVKLGEMFHASLSSMMTSMGHAFLHITDVLEVPREGVPRSVPFGYFTITSTMHIDAILSDAKRGVEERPFPAVKSPATRGVSTARMLYEMGLMMGRTPCGTPRKLFYAGFAQIDASLVAAGIPNLGAESFLREIKMHLTELNEETETDKE